MLIPSLDNDIMIRIFLGTIYHPKHTTLPKYLALFQYAVEYESS